MKHSWVLALAALCAFAGVSQGKQGFGEGEQEYGYVHVREGAHMFYWLYYTTARPDFEKRPLVMWLQGGPGASSTSYGNFEEIGPLTADLKERNTTWVKNVNLLLVDNPVGSGYSYVDNASLLTTNNQQIGRDLLELIRKFLKRFPKFEKVPFYVFCESYGGKMAAEFAYQLYRENQAGKIKVNFKGVGLGDSWISPIDSVLTWAPYLYHTGLLDQKGFEEVDKYAQKTKKLVELGNFYQATSLWSQTEQVIMQQAGNVDFYNILKPIRGNKNWLKDMSNSTLARADDDTLAKLMNGPVRKALRVPSRVTHGSQAGKVFSYLYTDFMKPVTDVVEKLLNTTNLEVVVYTGQLDLIVDTPGENSSSSGLPGQQPGAKLYGDEGTVAWVDRLKWPMADAWNKNTPRKTLVVNGVAEGFVKKLKNLSLYWINRAGHMVPADNPDAMTELLRIVTQFDK